MNIPGVQLVAELAGCDARLLNDEGALQTILSDAITACGLTLVKTTSHKFSPIGVTAIAIISESHIAVHTYPEACHASIDIFHCSVDEKPLYDLLEILKARLHARSAKTLVVKRGSKLEVVANYHRQE